MYKQTNTLCKPKCIQLFALKINCTIIIMKTTSRFSRNVYVISDRIWCNKHLRHTTTEKYDNNGKGGYFRFDDDNTMGYRYTLSITSTEMGQLNTYSPLYCNDIKIMHWQPVPAPVPPSLSLRSRASVPVRVTLLSLSLHPVGHISLLAQI